MLANDKQLIEAMGKDAPIKTLALDFVQRADAKDMP